MKYFIDTEFLEGTQQKRILGIPYGKTPPTIDLISIGIVSEDGREYYSISKDFNLKEAWNRYDLKPDIDNGGMKKVYWIRENVLKPIWGELVAKQTSKRYDYDGNCPDDYFSYNSLKHFINKYGKTNEEIANGIVYFIDKIKDSIGPHTKFGSTQPQFYGYYCDYDWVAFCWLFGKMIDLPKGFPMYCIDLKQMLDEKADKFTRKDFFTTFYFFNKGLPELTLEEKVKHIKLHVNYPKQTNEHNALADARWNKKSYDFIQLL